MNLFFQQTPFFVLGKSCNPPHFCIINHRQRRCTAREIRIDQQLRLFMRLYTGNRRGANERRVFYL
jgi:hypothetical protein